MLPFGSFRAARRRAYSAAIPLFDIPGGLSSSWSIMAAIDRSSHVRYRVLTASCNTEVAQPAATETAPARFLQKTLHVHRHGLAGLDNCRNASKYLHRLEVLVSNKGIVRS